MKPGRNDAALEMSHEYYVPDPSAPDGYIEQLRGRGRRFAACPEFYDYVEVIIDDETGTVFVKLIIG